MPPNTPVNFTSCTDFKEALRCVSFNTTRRFFEMTTNFEWFNLLDEATSRCFSKRCSCFLRPFVISAKAPQFLCIMVISAHWLNLPILRLPQTIRKECCQASDGWIESVTVFTTRQAIGCLVIRRKLYKSHRFQRSAKMRFILIPRGASLK